MSQLVYVVEAYVSIRGDRDELIKQDCVSVLVYDTEDVSPAVMDIIWRFWVDATPDDVLWSTPARHWDGVEKISWSTCAEIDGAVYVAQQVENVHG